MGHGGGDDHVCKYVHSTSLFFHFLCLSSTFLSHPFSFFFVLLPLFILDWDHHGIDNTLTAFTQAFVFNADLSKWDTAAVTSMSGSTSTPLLCSSVPCVFHRLFFSHPFLFSSFLLSLFFFSIGSTTALTILRQRSIKHLHSTRTFPSGTRRR